MLFSIGEVVYKRRKALAINGYYYDNLSVSWYAKKCSIKIDGKVYNFDASGYCTNP